MTHAVLALLRLLVMAAALALPVAAPAADAEPVTTPAAVAAPNLDPAAVKALVGILKDDTARAALIDNLEKVSAPATGDAATSAAAADTAAPSAPAAEPAPAATPAAPVVPLAKEIGSFTEELSRQALEVVSKIGYGLGNLWRLVDGSAVVDWENMREQGLALVVLMVFAFAIFTTLRYVIRYPLGILARMATGKSRIKRLPAVLLAAAIRLVAIGLTWFLTFGYAIATSTGGRIDLLGGQFIDAFVLIETVKALLYTIFEFRRPSLNPFSMNEDTAHFWYSRLSRLVGFVGYGVLVAHPIVNRMIGFSVGIGFRLAIVILGLLAAIALVLRTRDRVRKGLAPSIERRQGAFAKAFLALLVHGWHVIAIGYLLVAFAVWVSRPFDAIDFMAMATLETVVVIIVGGLIVNLLSQAVAGGIRLPAEARAALPLLESRLNLFVPLMLSVIRFVVVILVVAIALQSWGLIDVAAWFESARGTDLVGRGLGAFVVLLVAMAVWLSASSWIEYRLNPSLGRVTNARTRTLLSLFRNAFSVVVVVITTMLVLSQLGIDIAPLIAGAGVVGLAVGFGSQKLVQDIITGAFIQLENAMNEGDVVTVAGVSGVVDRLTIRSVGIRDGDGVYHIIPFSSVGSVSNAMRGFSYHVANLDVAYDSDITEVKVAMREAFDRLMQTDRGRVILEPLDMQGLTNFGPSAITVRARIKTLPGEQWATGRAYNELIKQVFDERGIEIPFPQTKIWVSNDDPFGKHGGVAGQARETD